MSRYVKGVDREQKLLLPECVEDYVGEDNAVRVIEAFVEGLDMAQAGFGTQPAVTGRMAYAPTAMLKLFIYGYLHRMRSSRVLESQCHCNLEIIWLLGQLRPDHKTISEFRRQNIGSFKKVLREFNLLCRDMGLFGRELLAIDGTVFKAVNGRHRNFTLESLQKVLAVVGKGIQRYLQEAEELDRSEDRASGKPVGSQKLQQNLARLQERQEHYHQLLQQMQAQGTRQVSLTDPDSRLMRKKTNGAATVGYNVQSAVDSKNHLIVVAEVTNQGQDFGQLSPMAVAAKEELGVEKLEVLADTGYRDAEDLLQCQQAGVTTYVPGPRKEGAAKGIYKRKEFSYDPLKDMCHCPAGKELQRHADTTIRGKVHQVYYNTAACAGCPLLAQCTKGKYRKFKRQPGQEAMEEAAARAKENKTLYALRKTLVEHPFGTLKFWWGQGAFLLRGRDKVSAEVQLSALAYNLRRVMNLLGVKELCKALTRAFFALERCLRRLQVPQFGLGKAKTSPRPLLITMIQNNLPGRHSNPQTF